MKTLLHTSQTAVVTLAITVATALLPGPNSALLAQNRLTDAQATALQPTPSDQIPAFGNFYSASFPENPPTPFDPFPNLPAYRFPDGSWLVDDTSVQFLPPDLAANAPAAARILLAQNRLVLEQSLLERLFGEATMSEFDVTNWPPPVSPSPPVLLAPGTAPTNGTFWMLVETNWPPFPNNPWPDADVWLLSDNSYLVDDTGVTWPEPGEDPISYGGDPPSYPTGALYLEICGVTNGLASMVLHGSISQAAYTILSSSSPAGPWDAELPLIGADDQDYTPFQVPTFGRRVVFFRALVGTVTPNQLWLYAVGISSNCLNVVLHGTSEGTAYDLQSVTSIGSGNNWVVETNFPGAVGQYWTQLSIPMSGRPSLFVKARSWTDSDSNNLPDWWEEWFFGTTDLDPYELCPSGDGWTILQACQNGWNPTNWYAPAAPTAWAYVTPAGNTRVIEWQPAPGLVQGYELVKYQVYRGAQWIPVSTQLVSAATHSLSDTSIEQPADDPDINPDGFRDVYLLYALYNQGPSLPALVSDTTTALNARLVHGPGDQMQLALLSAPNGTTAVRVHLATNAACGWGGSVGHTMDIPVSAFTNGLYSFSLAEYPFYRSYTPTVQAVLPSGFAGTARIIEPDCGKTIRYPFLDGSQVLRDNLLFTLQAQTAHPGADLGPNYIMTTEGLGLAYRPGYGVPGWPCPIPVYAAASYRPLSSIWVDPVWEPTPAPLHPWEINTALRNFEYTPSASTCWTLTNGLPWFWCVGLAWAGVDGGYCFDSAGFASNNVQIACPSVLAVPSGRFVGIGMDWIGMGSDWTKFDPNEPLINQGNGTCTIPAIHPNAFGLPLKAVICKLYDTNSWDWTYTPPFLAGASVPYDYNNIFADFERFEAPALQKDVYQFTPGGNLSAILPDAASTNGGLALTTPLIISIEDFGFNVSAWLRYHLTNGAPGVYGYVEQYLDKAYKLDTNGTVTAAETGILSPYGYFFPAEPGPVALVTRPNIEDGQRGTGVVHVIKLQLDVNHDGNMDLSFGGRDNTSQRQPLVFWANNDYDRGHHVDCGLVNCDWEEDDLKVAGVPDYPTLITPDYAYATYTPFQQPTPRIPSMRDLEDYARFWLPGMSSLMAAMPTNYTVKLTLTGDAIIRIFRAVESDGATDYLFSEVTASNQVAQSASLFVGLLTSASPITLSGQTNFSEHFIWCGAQRGTAEVHLQILDGNQNVFADTAAYIEIKDIKEMYERWTVGDRGTIAPKATAYLAAEDLPINATRFEYGPSSTNTPYILFVHGWNMERWEKDRFAEASFKRLYWQGYEGRFGIYRWPTYDKAPATLTPFPTTHFDGSECNAWRSGAPLRKLLVDLNAKYPGQVRVMAHSMGNVVVGEALRTNVTLVHTYVAMQSAIAAHAYDASVTNRDMGLYGPSTPNRFAAYPTNGMPCYFSSSTGASRFINFFNKDDWALGWWEVDQNLKPNEDAGYHYRPGQNGAEEYIRGHIFETSLYLPQDIFEIFPFIIEARSLALGAQANVGGVFRPNDEVDLRTGPLLFGDAHKGHSGQFRSTNMKRHVFWERTLQRMQLE